MAAVEILLPDDAVRNLIRQAKVEQIYSVMQTGTQRGMQTLEQALADLVMKGIVTLEVALGALQPARAARGNPEARRRPGRPSAACGRPELDDGARDCRSEDRGVALVAAHVSVNGSVELNQLASEPLPRGIVAGGEVKEVEALSQALKAFFKKHKLPKRNVRVGVANNRIGVRTIELQGIVDPKQVANAVRFRAQEALPIPLEEAVLDFQVLGESTETGGLPRRKVLLVVAYRDLIAGYAKACKTAGVRSSLASTSRHSRFCARSPP